MPAAIGTRYIPTHIVRRDSVSGVYEEINSPMDTNTERFAQLVMIDIPPYKSLWTRIGVGLVIGAFAGILYGITR